MELGKILVHRWELDNLHHYMYSIYDKLKPRRARRDPHARPLPLVSKRFRARARRHGVAEQQEEVVYARLPPDIGRRYVLLLDPVLGTGHTASRAVQVGGVRTCGCMQLCVLRCARVHARARIFVVCVRVLVWK